MKTQSVPLFLLKLLSIVFVIIFTNGPLTSQPKIHIVEGTQLDFGETISGATVKRDVTIKNIGNDTLEIKNVTAGCGCTASLLSEKILPPNDTGKLTITFNSKNFHGTVQKDVTVHSNDPATPQLAIQFKTKIIELLTINPRHLWYNNVSLDSIHTRTVNITNAFNKPITLLAVKDNSNNLTTKFTKRRLKPGEQMQLTFTLQPKQKGALNGVIEITTDFEKMPKTEIRYYGTIH